MARDLIPAHRHGTPLRAIALLAIAWLAATATHDAAAQAVVAGARSPATSLTAEQASQLFLAKSATLPGAGTVALIDLPESAATREAFYLKLTGKTPAQMKALWSRLAFSGSGQPPRTAGSAGELKKLLAADPNAIGYLDKADLDGSVKVLLALE